ncbi:MAG TPA: tRNA adenosine(34) deaminase TadA [Phototrophicaceae bacterium]|nr:tRNA adenosine(34) deaminase TadA [Phototrophicaceae bacterium]
MNDYDYMRLALLEAEKALASGDIPIGAVAVYQREVIGRGYNRREIDHDSTAHAEMIAIREASQHLGNWQLDGVTIYCTLEPCPMCAGAMVLARVPRLVYAAVNTNMGAAGSIIDILRHPKLNHRVDVSGGLLADEANQQLQNFFRQLR